MAEYITPVTLQGSGKRQKKINVIAGLEWHAEPTKRIRGEKTQHRTGQRITIRDQGRPLQLSGYTSEPGHLWSLAVLACERLNGNGYAVIRLNKDKLAFLACIRNRPVLDADVVGSEDIVRQAIRAFLTFHDNEVPENGWTEIGSVQQPAELSDVLPEILPPSRQAKLVPLNIAAQRAMIGMLCLALAGGAFWFTQWQETQRLEQIRLNNIAKKKLASLKAPVSQQLEIHPWIKIPTIQDFLEQCLPGIRELSVPVGDWLISAVECRADGMRVEYSRTPTSLATVEDLLEASRKNPVLQKFTEVIIADSGMKTQFRRSWTIPAGGDTATAAGTEHLAQFLNFFQKVGLDIRAKQDPVQKLKTITVDGKPVQLIRDFTGWSFSITTKSSPAVLQGIPAGASRLTSLAVSLDNDRVQTWKIEGHTWASNATSTSNLNKEHGSETQISSGTSPADHSNNEHGERNAHNGRAGDNATADTDSGTAS